VSSNPRPTSEDICEPRVYFNVILEVFGEEYGIESFWLNKARWEAMSSQEKVNFLAANEEQVRDYMNIYTQESAS